MAIDPQRLCSKCGSPVARRAEDCLTCGAHLRERKERAARLPEGNLWLPAVLVVAAAVLWLWKPWHILRPAEAEIAGPTASATPEPSAAYEVAPTATPLQTAQPTLTPTLPPNQTLHTVKKGETLIGIAKLYGTTAAAIRTANGLKTTDPIHEDDQLLIPLLTANTPTPLPTLPPTPTPQMYVVEQGDTLSQVAMKYGTTVEALMQANGITAATGIGAGTRLVIPPAAATSVPVVTYEVQSGDTLSGIASRYKVTVKQIMEANGMKSDMLRIGQKLTIKGGATTPAPTATEAPTAVPAATATPVATPVYSAPFLLAPADGASFFGADAGILLNWASVGILAQDEYYVLRMRRAGLVAEQVPPVWTQITSYRLPAGLYVAGAAQSQSFYWQVSVLRKTGEGENGEWSGIEISPRSAQRTFTWQ